MAQQTIATLKNWFRTGAKPLQGQFWDWLDSYWHKSETIPSSAVTGLDALTTRVEVLEGAASNKITLTGSGASITYAIPAGSLLEKAIIKSTATMSYTVSNTPGANDIPVGDTLTAGQLGLFYLDLYADGAPRNVYFETLSGSVTIILYLQR